MAHEKLISLRKERKISQEEMADKLAMEQTTYSRKERGKSPITKEEWIKIANLLEVDLNDLKDEQATTYKNENFTLHDNSVGVQHITVHQDLLETVLRYNKHLEAEIEFLKTKGKDVGDVN